MNNKNFSTPQIVANSTAQLVIQNINYSGHNKLKFISLGANTCFIGNSVSVNTTNGFPISNVNYLDVEISSNVYIICSSGTCNVATLTIN